MDGAITHLTFHSIPDTPIDTSKYPLDKADPMKVPLVIERQKTERGIVHWAMEIEKMTLFHDIRGLLSRLLTSIASQCTPEA